MTTGNRRPRNEARQALAAHRRALTKLIGLLQAPDEAVRQEAADALLEIDPPPVWQLFEAFGKCDDKGFRLLAIEVLEQMAMAMPAQVSFGVLRLLRCDLDPEVMEAVHRAATSIGKAYAIATPSGPART